MEKEILDKINRIIDLYEELDRIDREIRRLQERKEQIIYEIGIRIATVKYILRERGEAYEGKET